jgi:4-amino-4-deoxy-L-arabinose transferase-like glycosyltransferase
MGADSGLFAYYGQQILAGRVLYKDLWDEKPPGVYYVDALAILIAGETPWSIWWLGLAWIAATTIILFLILYTLTGMIPALAAALVFLLTALYPDYYQRGNFTEVYALLPQVLAIAALAKYLSAGKSRWVFFLGMMTAAAFLFKPTYIAMGLAALIVILYLDLRTNTIRQALLHLANFSLGTAAPLAAVTLYFASKGALQAMWEAVISYNLVYAKQGFSLRSIYTTLSTFAVVQPMATVFTVSMASLVVFLILNWPKLIHPPKAEQVVGKMDGNTRLWVFAGIFAALPVEWALVSVSGKNFGHYFLTPLPAMTGAWAYLASGIIRSLRPGRERNIWPSLALSLLAVLSLGWFFKVAVTEAPDKAQLNSFLKQPLSLSYTLNELEQYVSDNSSPAQPVLVWGLHPRINFVTGRRSPSRYAFPLPLLIASAGTGARFDQFMADLQAGPPALILAQPGSSVGIPFFGGDIGSVCQDCPPEVRAGVLELRDFVDTHYTLAKSIWDWQIYKWVK